MRSVRWRAPSVWMGLSVCLLGIALSVPPARSLIEQSMMWHMVIQMPALVAGGWLLAGSSALQPLTRYGSDWNQFGLTGFIVSQWIGAYWMLPLAIDRAVVMPQADALKVVSLIVCGGVLKASFNRSPAVLQMFFVGYAVSMLVSAGVFLAATDRRVCNAYSLDTQWVAGIGVTAIGISLACAWAFRLVRGAHPTVR